MRQQTDIQVRQDSVKYARGTNCGGNKSPFFAKIVAVYSERVACDIITMDGQPIRSVPVLSPCGLVDGKPYGEVDLPAVDDYVLVMSAGYSKNQWVIVGSIYPFLAKEFTGNVVGSDDKQFTKKLFVKGKPLSFKKILKSGTTIEVDEVGKITIETPDGSFFFMGGTDKVTKYSDPNDNIITINSSGIVIEDKNGNNFTMGSGKVTINGNLEVLQ